NMGLFGKLFGFRNGKLSSNQCVVFSRFSQQIHKCIQAKTELFSGPAQYCRRYLQGFHGVLSLAAVLGGLWIFSVLREPEAGIRVE
ncbi:MAG: hypothetical protein L0Y39_01895, partial [Methylococcaceae bacterium]|nr:hypothetical protein [Methylococcaceae bacterium]